MSLWACGSGGVPSGPAWLRQAPVNRIVQAQPTRKMAQYPRDP